MSIEKISALATLGVLRKFRRGTYVFQQGDDANELFMIVDGRVELTSTTSEGEERLHSILRPGNLFGEAELLTESQRMTTALAVDETTVWRSSRTSFMQFIEENPDVLRRLLAEVARRMQALDNLIEDLKTLPLKGRIAKALLTLALPADGGPLPRRTESVIAETMESTMQTIEITQSNLGRLCDGSRENVARVLADLQRRGAIRRTGHSYELTDLPYLRRLARLT